MIHCENVSKRYQKTTVLHEINLQISLGENVAILGQSGSGKSTLLNILALLSQASSGEYRLGNQRVDSLQTGELSHYRNQMIGIVFQRFFMIPYLTVLQNILLPLRFQSTGGHENEENLAYAESLLAQLNMADKRNHKPSQLSGGQQQRACIARALINQPKLLFADEPTGNLDSENTEAVMKIFDELKSPDRSIVIITHDQQVAKHYARNIEIKDGRIENDQIVTA